MSAGLDVLASYRLAGLKPAAVWITLADVPQRKFWRYDDPTVEIAIKPIASALRADYRPLVGCNVILIADDNTDILRGVVARICGVAESVLVSIVPDLKAGSPGHLWVRNAGWRAL